MLSRLHPPNFRAYRPPGSFDRRLTSGGKIEIDDRPSGEMACQFTAYPSLQGPDLAMTPPVLRHPIGTRTDIAGMVAITPGSSMLTRSSMSASGGSGTVGRTGVPVWRAGCAPASPGMPTDERGRASPLPSQDHPVFVTKRTPIGAQPCDLTLILFDVTRLA